MKNNLSFITVLVVLISGNLLAQSPAVINGESGYVVCGKTFKKDKKPQAKGTYRRMRVAFNQCPKGWTQIEALATNGVDGKNGEQGQAGKDGQDGSFTPTNCKTISAIEKFSYNSNNFLVGRNDKFTATLSCSSSLGSSYMLIKSGYRLSAEPLNPASSIVGRSFLSNQVITENQNNYVNTTDSKGNAVVVPDGFTISTEVNLPGLKRVMVVSGAADANAVIEMDGYCCPL
jgi:hypothetical protein